MFSQRRERNFPQYIFTPFLTLALQPKTFVPSDGKTLPASCRLGFCKAKGKKSLRGGSFRKVRNLSQHITSGGGGVLLPFVETFIFFPAFNRSKLSSSGWAGFRVG